MAGVTYGSNDVDARLTCMEQVLQGVVTKIQSGMLKLTFADVGKICG